MIPDLLSDAMLIPKPIKLTLMHISQRLTNPSMPRLPSQPSTTYIKPSSPIMMEKIKFYTRTHHQKNKSFSLGMSHTPVIKRDPSPNRQLLELPPNIRSESCSVDKVYVGSLLLKQRNSTRFYSKLPRVSVVEQIVNECRVQFNRKRDGVLGGNEFHVESRAIGIKSSNLLPEVGISSARGGERQKERVVMKPPLPNMSLSEKWNRLTMQRERERDKKIREREDSKKGGIDVLATRDSLLPRQFMQKSQQKTIQRPLILPQKPTFKYKKGYLIYDSSCHSCIPLLLNQCTNQLPPSIPLPFITSKLSCVLSLPTLSLLHLSSPFNFSQIASLSKIVTCLLTILICLKYQTPLHYKCRVSEQASSTIGTSAQLEVGDILTVEELLYGLMLPSGNDAAITLAECMGRVVQRKKKMVGGGCPVATFVKQMNVVYREILREQEKHKHVFRNPHGLPLHPNITTVEQITKFAAVALRNQTFSRIVNTKWFEIVIFNERYGIQRKIGWKNTNKLLEKGWEGVKTGTTCNAGHCFVGVAGGRVYALLDCETLEKRFSEAERLKEMFMEDERE